MSRTSKAAKANTAVIGYIRVSTDAQAEDGVSLDVQRTKLEAYALALDLNLVAIEVDAGQSAKSLHRPALQAALARLEAGEATGLLVAKLDRLTRSVRDLGELAERYFSKDFALLSVGDSIDTRTAGGRLVLNVLASVSQWEREAIGERTSEALQHIKANGGQLGGEALGWTRTKATDVHGRRIVADVKDEAETVARIIALRQQGLTYRAIAAAITAEGCKTKNGGTWHANTVRRVARRAA